MATGKDLAAAIRGYGQAFYDRSREPIGGNNLNIRWGDLLPYYGAGLGYDDARQQYEQGDVGAAALTAGMTAIPWGSLMRKGGGALREMTGYHGTPHKFDEFKMDKIGTGEGAQAYGHGLYFAGNQDTAKQYQRMLSGDDVLERITVDGRPLTDLFDERTAVDVGRALESTGLSPEKGVGKWSNQSLNEGLKSLVGAKIESKPQGNLYKADLPEDHELLDWDKPLSEQPEVLDAVLKREGITKEQALAASREMEVAAQGVLDGTFSQETYDAMSRTAAVRLGEIIERMQKPKNQFGYDAASKQNGNVLYNNLASAFGGQKGASEYLRSIGIPGLKYLDQGSRGAGKGTSNYVIWDEGKIKHMGVADK